MQSSTRLPVLLLLIRLTLLLSLPLEGLTGYGDLGHFHGWAALDGWPFLDYWMEFPPLFPFLGELVYRLVGGREHAFFYALALLFTAAEAASLAIFLRIANVVDPARAERRGWFYFTALAGLFYGWTYFDPLAVLALLAGTDLALRDDRLRAAAVFGLGGLLKWFPLLGLAALVGRAGHGLERTGSEGDKIEGGGRFSATPSAVPVQGAVAAVVVAAAVVAVGWGIVYLASPDLTLASLRSQSAKGSWETVWALVDGNLGTGNFGAKEERYRPEAALAPQGNPPVLPPALTLIPFALAGAWAALRADLSGRRARLAVTALALCLFTLWSPGWSPQWVLYFLPFILLLLPERRAVLVALVLVLVNLLEWPLLLSRGMFWGLYLTVPLRTAVIALFGYDCWRILERTEDFDAKTQGRKVF